MEIQYQIWKFNTKYGNPIPNMEIQYQIWVIHLTNENIMGEKCEEGKYYHQGTYWGIRGLFFFNII